MTPADENAMRHATATLDGVTRAMERKWGTGRLALLVSDTTRASAQRGWSAWRNAATANDPNRVIDVAGKLRAAWAFMDREAEAAGHKPLNPVVWEARMPDGRVLAVVQTLPEAHQVAQDGRGKIVWTMDELARVIGSLDILGGIKRAFPGAEVQRVVQHGESYASDLVTGCELLPALHPDDECAA